MVLIAVILIPVLPLVPIVVAFFIIFPMLYEGMNGAINNVDKRNLEMANVFNVSKKIQIQKIYIPAMLPYIFSSFVAAFGLTFKITIASQMVQSFISATPDYPSIGMIIAGIIKNNGNYAIIIAWGMIAILISLIMELIIKETGRICMPFKYNDRKNIIHFFNQIRKHHA
jgi:NitT/TauT family transport system permease protein